MTTITVMLQWDEISSIIAIIGLPRTVCGIIEEYIADGDNVTTVEPLEAAGYVFIKVYRLRLTPSAIPYTRRQSTMFPDSPHSRY